MDRNSILKIISACVSQADNPRKAFSTDEQTLLSVVTNPAYSDTFRLAAAQELAFLANGKPAAERTSQTKKVKAQSRVKRKRFRMNADQQSALRACILEAVKAAGGGASKGEIRKYLKSKQTTLGFAPSDVQLDTTVAAMVSDRDLSKVGERSKTAYWSK